jgi:hypothetical protein
MKHKNHKKIGYKKKKAGKQKKIAVKSTTHGHRSGY